MSKLTKYRQQRVPVGGYTFVVLRPTELQMAEIRAGLPMGSKQLAGLALQRALLGFVVGWEGVTEGDVLPGGMPHPLEFDADLCAEWLSDRLDLLVPLAEAVIDLVRKRREDAEARAKNSLPGSDPSTYPVDSSQAPHPSTPSAH